MIGDFDERYEIYEGTESTDYEGTSISYSDSPDITVWGKEISADSRVRQQFQSLDSEITSILKLQGNPTLKYAHYKLVRVGDGQEFKPEAPPVRKGEFTKVTYIGVKRAEPEKN